MSAALVALEFNIFLVQFQEAGRSWPEHTTLSTLLTSSFTAELPAYVLFHAVSFNTVQFVDFWPCLLNDVDYYLHVEISPEHLDDGLPTSVSATRPVNYLLASFKA